MSQLSDRKAAWEAKSVAKTLARGAGARGAVRDQLGHPGRAAAHAGRRGRGVSAGRRGVPGEAGLPGRIPFHPRRPADDVPRPLLDHAPVCRVRHRGREQPALQIPAGAGADRPQRGVRPAHPDRLRRRRSDLPGRSGQGRRGDLVAGRHGDAARRHPAGQGQHQHDHQRAGRDPAGDGDRGGAAAGRRSEWRCAARCRTIS